MCVCVCVCVCVVHNTRCIVCASLMLVIAPDMMHQDKVTPQVGWKGVQDVHLLNIQDRYSIRHCTCDSEQWIQIQTWTHTYNHMSTIEHIMYSSITHFPPNMFTADTNIVVYVLHVYRKLGSISTHQLQVPYMNISTY